MEPQNQEYHEAQQASVDEYRKKFYATLTEHEKAQFDAVEQACKLLVDAGVLFYLFPMLPDGSGRPEEADYASLWQYNSLDKFVKYDAAGRLTQKDQLLIDCFNGLLVRFCVGNLFRVKELDEESCKRALNIINFSINTNLNIPKTALVKKAE